MNVLYLQTIQASAFRVLLDALKEIITEANIQFDHEGMKIKTMDASHTVLIHLLLEANKFEKYESKARLELIIKIYNIFDDQLRLPKRCSLDQDGKRHQ